MTDPPMWTLQEGVEYARYVEGKLIPIGYHCAIGGGVLHTGSSAHDLDIFVYPHDAKKPAEPSLIMAAIGVSGWGECDEKYQPNRDPKEVIWAYVDNNKRVDFFFLGELSFPFRP